MVRKDIVREVKDDLNVLVVEVRKSLVNRALDMILDVVFGALVVNNEP